jgi:hypothetical protein
MHSTAVKDTFSAPIKLTIDKYLKKQPHLAAIFALAGSNKRLCKAEDTCVRGYTLSLVLAIQQDRSLAGL